MSTTKAILQAIGVLKGSDPKVVAQIADDADAAAKALTAQSLSPSEEVKDRWQEGEMHTHATKEEIKVGPPQSASGSGATKMIGEYSHNAPQHGTTLTTEQLGEELGQMRGYMKALAQGQSKMTEALSALAGVLVSKAESE